MKLLLLFILLTFTHAETILRTQLVMGTLVTIKIEKKDAKYINESFDIIRNIDDSISTFKENSIVSKLNKYKKVKLDSISFEALDLSKKYYKNTYGYFNITIGSITKDLFRFGEDERVPSKESLVSAKVNFDALVFDTNKASLLNAYKVDLGGMGKGYGVDKINEYLRSKNVNNAVVSASGDIRCLGVCTIGIQSPFSDALMLTFKTLKINTGISTSGNYNRYVKDKINNHLINPNTKQPARNFTSITLVGDMKSSALDAYATAISVMPKDKAYKFLDNLDVGYVVVEVDGKSLVKPFGFFDLVLNQE